ncbi:hypothetical protein [Bacteroides gallinarum]|uniref:hypothetical protein n=1 Tax=Bacteroides gallinarum TaxID=376806 RepID=UPI000365E918|nr:hypothetical protein [Bacteroides gallinarum]
MKNYFIANGEYLHTEMSVEEMEKLVQNSLDETTSGMTQFRIKEISEKEIRMVFIRDFIQDPNEPRIYDTDCNLITGLGIAAFRPLEIEGYPMIYPLHFAGKNFYTDIPAFIRFYKLLMFMELNQKVEHIGIRCYSDRILMQIIF